MGVKKCKPLENVSFEDIYGCNEFNASIPDGWRLTGAILPTRRNPDLTFLVEGEAIYGHVAPAGVAAVLEQRPHRFSFELPYGSAPLVFLPTGEFRAPKDGEYYRLGPNVIRMLDCSPQEASMEILKRIEPSPR